MFYVGQRVTLIKPQKSNGIYGEAYPLFGVVYTIRAIFMSGNEELLQLVEIVNPPHRYVEGFKEAGFGSSYFRPVVDRPTSIEIFTRMLNPSDKRETV